MPKIPKPLSETKIKNTKPKEKAYTLPDGGGLQLLIKPNGTKLWEFYYQSPTLYKRRKTSLGTYPSVTLKQARQKRETYCNFIYDGIDPIDYNNYLKLEAINKQDGLFEEVAKEWLKIKKLEVENKIIVLKTYQRVESLLLNDTVPHFKKINIKDIKRRDIIKVIEIKNKTAPVSAKRLLQYLNKLWLFAVSKEYTEHNLIAAIDGVSHITKTNISHHSIITDLTILEELINAIYTYNGHYSTRNALRLVLHLPLRAKNLVSVQWQFIDFDKKVLTIPRAEMKVRNSNLRDFILPLTDEVICILKEQYMYTSNNKYVFVSDYGLHLNIETTNRALQRMGFNDEKRGRKQRTHSFRGTYRSLASTYQTKHNATLEVKEAILDHQTGDLTTKAYDNMADYLEQMRALMDWWSGFIVEMIDE